jgi:pimeloyl-ACP methyl ester carboxylesterase
VTGAVRSTASFRHRHIALGTSSIHVVDAVPAFAGGPTVLFLHGWPQDWTAFAAVMSEMRSTCHVVAVDLPGIGQSSGALQPGDKRALARLLHDLVEQLDLGEFALVGHDVGGQIAFTYLHAFPRSARAAAIMDVVIPGIPPWDDVVRNPYLWHFAFHAVPELPELLVDGHQRAYFDYFFDTISASPDAIPADAREQFARSYGRRESLTAGFDWYRAYPQDAELNTQWVESVDTPVLCVRGDAEPGDLDTYVAGLRGPGRLSAVQGATIDHSGHFAPNERPDRVAQVLRDFVLGGSTSRSDVGGGSGASAS